MGTGTAVEDDENVHVWAVYLEIQRSKSTTKGRCVGTLIHERYVLTAAHCVHNLKFENIKLYFGLFLISTLAQCLADRVCQERRAAELIVHQDYNSHARLNDIALIRVSEAVQFTQDVRPACLPFNYLFDESLASPRVLSFGWGEYQQGTMSDSKRIVQLEIIKEDECGEQLKKWQRFNTSMLSSVMCTVGVLAGQDVCEGDSGAPIVHIRDDRYFVIGVVSFGPKCGMGTGTAEQWCSTHYNHCSKHYAYCDHEKIHSCASYYATQHNGEKTDAYYHIEDDENIHVWAVYLEIQRSKSTIKGRCVGTLIQERYVLTAAHCVHNLKLENIKLYFGLFLISTLAQCLADRVCQERRAAELIVHQDYNSHARLNDIALMRVSEAVQFTDDVRPACLPLDYLFDESLANDSRVLSLGWGEYQQGTMSDSKRIVALNVIGQEDCGEQLRKWQRFNASMLFSVMCTVGVQAGQDVCQGDSGAPILQLKDGRFFLVGVVSFGPKCGMSTGKAGMSMRVSEYKNWILANLKRIDGGS
uniref:Peptidase S1 domain-containing protein n=1 Tax=Anopheles melas TaxID=34690 RepID=A0A182TQW0_9DIPT